VMIAGVIALVWVRSVAAQQYTIDRSASDSLTSYLRHHRLPLVSAQVLRAPGGAKRVVLSGFVASDFGRKDAEDKALAQLGANGIPVDNRIVVRPEIRELGSHAGASSGAEGSAASGVSPPAGTASAASGKSFDQIMNEIHRYGIQSPPDEQGFGNQ